MNYILELKKKPLKCSDVSFSIRLIKLFTEETSFYVHLSATLKKKLYILCGTQAVSPFSCAFDVLIWTLSMRVLTGAGWQARVPVKTCSNHLLCKGSDMITMGLDSTVTPNQSIRSTTWILKRNHNKKYTFS